MAGHTRLDMRTHRPSIIRFRPSLPFVLLLILLSVLWLAGGASRADTSGQVVVRAASSILLIVALLFGALPDLRQARPVLIILGATLALALLQLVPLPPAWWQALPGRSVLAHAATASGQSQPWRPWSIVPGATVNAATSLIVPLAIALLLAGTTKAERAWLPGILLVFVAAATFVGLLQFSGAGFSNPFVNDTPGEVSGTFANRNHFALLLAMGCLLTPVWAFLGGRRPHWRGPVAIGLVLLFLLTVLASGSRAGLGFGAFGLVVGLLTVGKQIRRTVRDYPRWVFVAAIVGAVGLVAAFVLVSFVAGRAVSIDRVLSTDLGQDMRSRGLPTVLGMIGTYFPIGSGLGGFDPIFRIHEPFALLKPTYFNHAHNDWLEVVLDAGLPGLLLMLGAVAWWGASSLRAWRAGQGSDNMLPKLGSSLVLLVMGASTLDYPARTPTMMAILVIAGLWLAEGRNAQSASALPEHDQHL